MVTGRGFGPTASAPTTSTVGPSSAAGGMTAVALQLLPGAPQSTQAPAAQGRPSPGARHDGPNRSTLKTGHPEKEAAPTPLSPSPPHQQLWLLVPSKEWRGTEVPATTEGEERGRSVSPSPRVGKASGTVMVRGPPESPPWKSLASPAPRPHCTRGQGAEPRGAGPGARRAASRLCGFSPEHRAARRQEVTVTHRAS